MVVNRETTTSQGIESKCWWSAQAQMDIYIIPSTGSENITEEESEIW